MSRVNEPLIAAFCWSVGAVLLPLALVLYLVVGEGASFRGAVAHGELFALAVTIAGASTALEMILAPGRLGTSLYQFALVLILLANGMMFAGTARVRGAEVITRLDEGQVTTSVVSLGITVICGVAAVVRQARQLSEERQRTPHV